MPYFKLLEELHSLQSIEKTIQKELKNAPEGSLYASRSHGRVQFYQIIPGQKRRYLGTHSTPLIQALAQKHYNQRLLKVARKDLAGLESFMKKRYADLIEELPIEEESLLYNEKAAYLAIRPEIKQFVTPHVLTNEDLALQWEAQSHHKSWLNQEECIWEHFGIMDDPLYMERALRKIDAYAERGYVLGEKLIATFESRMVPLNTKTVDAIIDRLR